MLPPERQDNMQELYWVFLITISGGLAAMLNSLFDYIKGHLDSKIKSQWGKDFTARALDVGRMVVAQVSQTYLDRIKLGREAGSEGGVLLTDKEKEEAYKKAFTAGKEAMGEAYIGEARKILGDSSVEATLRSAIESAVKYANLNTITSAAPLQGSTPEAKGQPDPASDTAPKSPLP